MKLMELYDVFEHLKINTVNFSLMERVKKNYIEKFKKRIINFRKNK